MKKKNKEDLLILEQALRATRQFFQERGFHEIVVPILNEGLPLEPNLYAFKTHWHYAGKTHPRYLPTSPEAALKKALAQGIEPVFAISPTFRDYDPDDEDHSPEFLMLEWYRANADYTDIMDEVEEYVIWIKHCLSKHCVQNQQKNQKLQALGLDRPWKKLSLEKLFFQATGVELKNCLQFKEIQAVAKRLGYQTKQSNWEQLFNQIFADKIEPKLGSEPLFVTDYPAQISPLCKIHASKPYLAERFEAYLGGAEIANGNNEQTNVKIIKSHIEREGLYRKQQKLSNHYQDEEFLSAIKVMHSNNTNYSGVGLGIERVIKLLRT